MKCPSCGRPETKVIDSRDAQSGEITRRRRECTQCNARFTTYERVEEHLPLVVKKDGRREDFSRTKIMEGIQKACQKRPMNVDVFEDILRNVEKQIQNLGVKEVYSQHIGRLVMEQLRKKDKVAYVRFASVYRDFQDVEEFVAELHQSGLTSNTDSSPRIES